MIEVEKVRYTDIHIVPAQCDIWHWNACLLTFYYMF